MIHYTHNTLNIITMMGWYNGYGGGLGFGGGITMLLMWVVLILAIAALWKYLRGKK